MRERRVFLLAAGRGRRAGGPKAWREDGGATALARHAGFLRTWFDEERLSVTIQAPWRAACLPLAPAARWVDVDPDGSPLAALQACLKDRPSGEWGFLYHIDMPVTLPAVFEALDHAARQGVAEAYIAAHGGRRGHPVLLSPALYEPITRLDPASGRLDLFLRGRTTEAVDLPVPEVLRNDNLP